MRADVRPDSRLAKRIRRGMRVFGMCKEVAEVRQLIDYAHENALKALSGEAADLESSELAWAKYVLSPLSTPMLSLSATAPVNGKGEIVGGDPYEKLDPNWLEVLAEYLEHLLLPRPRFGRDPQLIDIPNDTSIAIAGDWATGYWEGPNTASRKVATGANQADYTIHIGDTYYAGTTIEIKDHLVNNWPFAQKDSFAVPGNHEMYSKGRPFAAALKVRFSSQNRTTFFALRNDHWLLLALDTAYFAKVMYLHGTLGPETYRRWLRTRVNEQREFVNQQLGQRGTRRVLLFTHHPPIELEGTGAPRPLEKEILDLFVTYGMSAGPDYWAWGHLHGAIVYKPVLGKYKGRLIGHGAIPYGDATNAGASPAVQWHETTNASDPNYPMRVKNGYLLLELSGAAGKETFVDEDGGRPYSSTI